MSMADLRFFTFLLLAVIVPSSAASALAAVPLAEERRPMAIIVDNGHEEHAKILQEYIQKIARAKLPVVAEASFRQGLYDLVGRHDLGLVPMDEHGNRAALILQLVDKVPGSSERETSKQAYRIHTDGNALYLSAATELGLTYAVWGFLTDYLDCRFYRPDFEVVPEQDDLQIEQANDLHEPAFQIRGFVWPPVDKKWLAQNRGGGLPANRIVANHDFYRWIPPDEYFDDYPEWFPMRDGQRRPDPDWSMGLCTTNEGLAEEIARKLMETMANQENPEVPISIGQGDGYMPCECDECRTVAQREQSEAGPIYLMLNRVMTIAEKQFPEHTVVAYAYHISHPVPKNIRPHKNLWLNLVSGSVTRPAPGDQMGRIRNNPANRTYHRGIKEWPRVAPGRVTIWHWAVNYRELLYEWPNIFNLPDDIRLWHENVIAGAQLQIADENTNWHWLRNWLVLQLMWNPSSDEFALVRRLLVDCYGAQAAEYLWD